MSFVPAHTLSIAENLCNVYNTRELNLYLGLQDRTMHSKTHLKEILVETYVRDADGFLKRLCWLWVCRPQKTCFLLEHYTGRGTYKKRFLFPVSEKGDLSVHKLDDIVCADSVWPVLSAKGHNWDWAPALQFLLLSQHIHIITVKSFFIWVLIQYILYSWICASIQNSIESIF